MNHTRLNSLLNDNMQAPQEFIHSEHYSPQSVDFNTLAG